MKIRVGIIFFLLLLMGSKVTYSDYSNRVKGAVIGAALGDALGRVTEFIDTIDAIKKKYGPSGVSSFESFKSSDWYTHSLAKTAIAPYTDDTVMARMVLETVLEGHEKGWHRDVVIGELGKKFIKLFGPDRYKEDLLFDIRAHGFTNAASTKELAKLSLQASGTLWWYRGPQDYDSKWYKEVLREAGCGSVMRAWPLGIIYKDNIEVLKKFADDQSKLTHRNPKARAASVAIAVGTAYALQGAEVDKIVQEMIRAAEQFDEAEKLYKPHAQKIIDVNSVTPHVIALDGLFTSDMIQYAAYAARIGKTPAEVLGTHNYQLNYKSPQGFLLGWAADEAIAAAVYVFVRHSNDLKAALCEGVNTPGDSDSIATLAGALVGACTGLAAFDRMGFSYDVLEDKQTLLQLAEKAAAVKVAPMNK